MSDQARTQLAALSAALLAASRAAAELAATWPVESVASAVAPALFSVATLATHLGCSRSAAREWCEQGRFPGAFKLNGRTWRIPAEAVAAFVAEQAASAPHQVGRGRTIPPTPSPRGARRRARPTTEPDLSAWRKP